MPARSPEEIDVLFQQAIQAGDLDAVMDLYESDAAFPNQSGELRSGVDAIRQEMAPFAAMKPDIKVDIKKVITAGDIAVMHGEWSMTTPAQMSGRSVEVVRRQPDGSWRFVIDDPFTLGA